MNLIEQMIEDEFVAGNAGDVETLLELRTADAVEIFPGAPPLIGRDAIREAWNQETSVVEQFTDRSIEEINVAGDWAFIRFSFTHTVTSVTGGKPSATNSQGLWVIRRQSDGSWKIHWEMVNSSDTED